MKILEIQDDPNDKDMNILFYELTDEEKIMLADLSIETDKHINQLIQEGFLNSADNFKDMSEKGLESLKNDTSIVENAVKVNEDKNENRTIDINNTTVGKLIDALFLFDRDCKVRIPVYPPGDDTIDNCSIEYWKGEVEIEGRYKDRKNWG